LENKIFAKLNSLKIVTLRAR